MNFHGEKSVNCAYLDAKTQVLYSSHITNETRLSIVFVRNSILHLMCICLLNDVNNKQNTNFNVFNPTLFLVTDCTVGLEIMKEGFKINYKYIIGLYEDYALRMLALV